MVANCEELKSQVEAFREVAPLAAALRAPGMRQRHWEQLSAQVRRAVSHAVAGTSTNPCQRFHVV
jgi:hypothetical protein